jgi:ribose transport system permease protein
MNFIFGTGDIAGVPILHFWTLLFLVVRLLLFNKTPYGKKVLATGRQRRCSPVYRNKDK